MFQEMRRKRQALGRQECEEILKRNTSGVLALAMEDDYPYAVPLSYVYTDAKIYFHSALEGYKINAIKTYPKASFCVIDQDDLKPEEYTTYFRSVIAFGPIRILEDKDEIGTAIEALAIKYYPEDEMDHRSRTIAGAWNRFCMIELSVAHMSGKQAKELVKA